MIQKGTRLREKETGEILKVTECSGSSVSYIGPDREGQVSVDQLPKDFDVLDDPVTREDIEAVLKSKIEDGEADTGLYETGLSYVVVDRVSGEFTFQWFGEAMALTDLLQ